MNIILCGFKNSGKTTVGRELAKITNRQFFDTDYLLEELYFNLHDNKKLKAHEIYQIVGEKTFRELELKVVSTLKLKHNIIIATGGGTVICKNCVDILKGIGKLIYLKVPKQILKKRLLEDTNRGLFNVSDPEILFEKIYNDRICIYESVADYIVDVGCIDVKSIVELILQLGFL
jgi:shikimate kinase